mmetsp:Transcript_28658/g.89097  ORF Transcript_28658/g.89097 Transcript_28658/m.89097 type:complete len:206 (-) Transcript_28658:44-661(-)
MRHRGLTSTSSTTGRTQQRSFWKSVSRIGTSTKQLGRQMAGSTSTFLTHTHTTWLQTSSRTSIPPPGWSAVPKDRQSSTKRRRLRRQAWPKRRTREPMRPLVLALRSLSTASTRCGGRPRAPRKARRSSAKALSSPLSTWRTSPSPCAEALAADRTPPSRRSNTHDVEQSRWNNSTSAPFFPQLEGQHVERLAMPDLQNVCDCDT